MDFHSMKRKELQALCKKHSIPANLTNLEMANNLASLLKEKGKPVARGKSCFRSTAEQPGEILSDGVNKESKKVRFSPENETIMFLNSGAKPQELGRGARRRSMLRQVVKIEDIASERNLGNVKFSSGTSNKPVRLTRSRAGAGNVMSEGENLAVPDAADAKRLKRDSISIAQERVSTVEVRVLTRKSLEKKEAEKKKEVSDDALLKKNPTKRTSRKSGMKVDDEVSEIDTASRKEMKELNVDVVLKKYRSQRTSRSQLVISGPEIRQDKELIEDNETVETQQVVRWSRRNMKQIEDRAMLNPVLGEVGVVRKGRVKRQQDHLVEDAKVTKAALKNATDIELVLQVKKPSRHSSRSIKRRQSVMPHTEKLGGDGSVDEGENDIQLKSTAFEENARSRKSSLRSKSTEVSETILAQNDTKKKPRSGKIDPVLEEENVVKESTHVEEAPRRSSRNINGRKSIMPQTEKTEADGSKGRNEISNQLKTLEFEENAKARRSSSRRKSTTVSETIIAENVGKNKRRSIRLGQVLEEENAEIEGSSLDEEPPRKPMRKGAKAQKILVTVKTGRVVTRLRGTTEEPNARSEPLEEIIPVIEQVVSNSQTTMAERAESSNSPVMNNDEVLGDNADEEIQGKIGISGIEIDAKTEGDEIQLPQDCAANEDNFDSNNLALLKPDVELNMVKDVVPLEASLGQADYTQIDQPAKAAKNMDLQKESGMGASNETKIQASDSLKQDHDEIQAKLDDNPDLEKLEVDNINEKGENTDSRSEMSHDKVDVGNGNESEDEDSVEPEVVIDNSDVEKNTPSEVKAIGTHEEQPSVKIEGNDDIEHNVEGCSAQSKGTNSGNGHFKISREEPEDSSVSRTSVRKETTPTKMENVVGDGEKNTPSEVKAIETHEEQPSMEIEGNDDIEHNVEGCSAQSKGTNSWKSHFEIGGEEPENSSVSCTSVRKETTPTKMEKVVSDGEKNTPSEVNAIETHEEQPSVEIEGNDDIEHNVEGCSAQSKGTNSWKSHFEIGREETENSSVSCTSVRKETTPTKMEKVVSDGEKNTPCEVNAIETHEEQPSVEIEGNDDIEHNVEGCSTQSKGTNSGKSHFEIGREEPEDSSVSRTLVRKETTPTKMEKVASDDVENPAFIEPEDGEALMYDLETEGHLAQVNGSVLKEKFEIINKEGEHSCCPDSSDQNRITASEVEQKQRGAVDISPLGSKLVECTNSSSWVSVVKGETMVEKVVMDTYSAVEVTGLKAVADPIMLDLDVAESVRSSIVTSRDNASSLKKQQHSTRAATPISNEIKSLMLVNLDKTPASEFRIAHNSMLQENHATSASATVEQVENLNKVLNENSSGVDRHIPLPQRNLVDKPRSPFTLCGDIEMEKPELSMCTENLIASQEAHNSGERSKIHSFEDGFSTEPEESEGTETECDAGYNKVTTEKETQPFQAISPQITSGGAEHQDVAESVGSPSVTSRNNASSLKEQNHSIRIATPLSVSNEIKSLMLANLDKNPAFESGKVRNLMPQEDQDTSAVATVKPVEDLNKVTNESTGGLHHHSPFPQEDHVDKPNNHFTLFEDFITEKPESGVCAENLMVSRGALNSGEQSQSFGDICSTDYNIVSAESETQPLEATSPQTSSDRAEHQGNGNSNIEVSPTELKLLFDDEQHGEGMTMNSTCNIAPPSVSSGFLTQSKDDDESNVVDLCLGNSFVSEEEKRNDVTEEDLLGLIECKNEVTRVIGSYDDSFADNSCVKRTISPSVLAYRASASKSIHGSNLLEESNKGVGEMVPERGHENAPRDSNAPGALDILPAENIEETLTSSIREGDFVHEDHDNVPLMDDVNGKDPEELRPINFDFDKHKMAWEQSEGTCTAIDKPTTETEDEDLVNVSHQFVGDVAQVDEGMFDDLDGYEMEMVQEMFHAEEVDSPSYTDHFPEHEKASVEENAPTSADNEIEIKEKVIKDMTNFVSNEASAFEEGLESTQKLRKIAEVANETHCGKSSSKDMVQSFVGTKSYADRQNLGQASWSQDDEFGPSQASLDSNMFSSWELNLFSPATKSTPVALKAPFTDSCIAGDNISKGIEDDKESNLLETERSRIPAGDITETEAFGLNENDNDSLLGENIACTGVEVAVDEATRLCEVAIRSDSIIEDKPSESADRAAHGAYAVEDLVIVTNLLAKQEQLNSSRMTSPDAGTGFKEDKNRSESNICEYEHGKAVDEMESDVFDDQGLTVSSLFPTEANIAEVPFSMEYKYVEASEQVAGEITRKETNPSQLSEELTVETGDTLVRRQSFGNIVHCTDYLGEHTEVQNLSQDYIPNATGDYGTVVSSSSDQTQPFSSAAEDIEQNMELVNVENTFDEVEKGEISAFETNSTFSKMKKRSNLIQGTPNKLASSFDMKENATSIKRESLASVTAKSTAKRRALRELPK